MVFVFACVCVFVWIWVCIFVFWRWGNVPGGWRIKNNNLHIWIADYPICILIHIYACSKIKSQREKKHCKDFPLLYLKIKQTSQTPIFREKENNKKRFGKMNSITIFSPSLLFINTFIFLDFPSMCVSYHIHLHSVLHLLFLLI